MLEILSQLDPYVWELVWKQNSGPRGLSAAGSGGAEGFRFGVRETEEDLIGRDIRDWEDREVGELRGASSL